MRAVASHAGTVPEWSAGQYVYDTLGSGKTKIAAFFFLSFIFYLFFLFSFLYLGVAVGSCGGKGEGKVDNGMSYWLSSILKCVTGQMR